MSRLNGRQRRFAELYSGEGTGVHAARRAGYRGSEARLASTASRLLANPRVAAVVRERGILLPGEVPAADSPAEELEAEGVDPVRFWRDRMVDPGTPPAQRQRASERLFAHLERQRELEAEGQSVAQLRKRMTEILTKITGAPVWYHLRRLARRFPSHSAELEQLADRLEQADPGGP